MQAPGRRTRFMVMGLAAAIGLALAIGWAQRASGPPGESADETRSAALAPTSVIEIDATGRRTLDHASLPSTGVVRVRLDLPRDARGDGLRDAVVVAVDGRRLEARTRPLADSEDDVELDIEATFLRPGRYMVHIDTAEQHPLHFKRYVLEID